MPARKKMKKQPEYKCTRCQTAFGSKRKLLFHSKRHLQAQKEIEMLRQGKMPDETKIGGAFKGKNKVVIS